MIKGQFYPPEIVEIDKEVMRRSSLGYDPYDPKTFGADCRYPVWKPTRDNANALITVLDDHAYIIAQAWPVYTDDRIYDKTVEVHLLCRHIPSGRGYDIIASSRITTRDEDGRGWDKTHEAEVERTIAHYQSSLVSYVVEGML